MSDHWANLEETMCKGCDEPWPCDVVELVRLAVSLEKELEHADSALHQMTYPMVYATPEEANRAWNSRAHSDVVRRALDESYNRQVRPSTSDTWIITPIRAGRA